MKSFEVHMFTQVKSLQRRDSRLRRVWGGYLWGHVKTRHVFMVLEHHTCEMDCKSLLQITTYWGRSHKDVRGRKATTPKNLHNNGMDPILVPIPDQDGGVCTALGSGSLQILSNLIIGYMEGSMRLSIRLMGKQNCSKGLQRWIIANCVDSLDHLSQSKCYYMFVS